MSTLEAIDYTEGGGPGVLELPSEIPGVNQEQEPEVLGPGDYPGWEQEHFETVLLGIGSGVHMLIGQGETDFLMTQEDLRRIAPPMCRIANRWEPALRASVYADPILVGYGLTVWAWRGALERARAIRDREEDDGGPPAAGYVRTGPGPSQDDDGGHALEPDEEELGEGFTAVQPRFPQAAKPRWSGR
jgi:hypothetical protein